MKSMKFVCDKIEIFIAALYNAGIIYYNNAQARVSYSWQYIQCNSLHVHKSNVKLHELDVYSQYVVVIYLPM